ncbi:unnamed protein product, partial [Ectocarpus sp. 8 AP-2014]
FIVPARHTEIFRTKRPSQTQLRIPSATTRGSVACARQSHPIVRQPPISHYYWGCEAPRLPCVSLLVDVTVGFPRASTVSHVLALERDVASLYHDKLSEFCTGHTMGFSEEQGSVIVFEGTRKRAALRGGRACGGEMQILLSQRS